MENDGVPERLLAAGWQVLPLHAYSHTIAPVLVRPVPGGREVGMLTGEGHANNRPDTVHGGALMTFADIALGIGAVDAVGNANCATVQLNFQFLKAGRVGQFVTCRPEVVRQTRRLVFVRGLIEADGVGIGSADGIFNFFEGPGVRGD